MKKLLLDLDNILGIVLVMGLSSRHFFDKFLFLLQNLLTVNLAVTTTLDFL